METGVNKCSCLLAFGFCLRGQAGDKGEARCSSVAQRGGKSSRIRRGSVEALWVEFGRAHLILGNQLEADGRMTSLNQFVI